MSDVIQDNIVLIMFAFFALCLVYVFFVQASVARWPSTRGELLEGKVSEYRTNKQSEFFGRVKYSYMVGSRNYVGDRLSPTVFSGRSAYTLISRQLGKIQYHSDGSVKVFYNPNNPAKSYLVNRNWFNAWVPEN